MEPEKTSFVSQIEKTIKPILKGSCEMVIPRRTSMESYPEFQKYSEGFGNLHFKTLTGYDLDLYFGPRIFKRELIPYFLQYKSQFEDRWDSFFAPVVAIIKAKHKVESINVDFTYPKSQQDFEENNLSFYDKRLDNLNNIMKSCEAEWIK